MSDLFYFPLQLAMQKDVSRIIAFDLDGTLSNTLPSIHAALNEALRHFNLKEIDQQRCRKLVGYGAQKLIEWATDGSANVEEILKYYVPLLSDHSSKAPCFEGIKELLQSLSQQPNTVIAITSNKPRVAVQEFVKKHGLEGTVSAAIGVSETIRPKPEPDMINELRRTYNCSNVYVVGDTEVDFKFAKAANAKPIIVSYGFRTEDELHSSCGPELAHLCRSVAELKDTLDKCD